MISQPLDLLAQAVAAYIFSMDIHDTFVDLAATFMEHPTVRDVVSE